MDITRIELIEAVIEVLDSYGVDEQTEIANSIADFLGIPNESIRSNKSDDEIEDFE